MGHGDNLRADAVTPRAYQEAIVKEAVKRNTLVVLPTGLGKTLISALASAHILELSPDMKVLMMAPTRPLVMQHRESFLEVLDMSEDDLVVMTGHVAPRAREGLWADGKVFFTTPQVVENDIEAGRLTLRDFGLVVFDEAHRAVKDYAYSAIARHYMEEGTYPMVLGLTASPGGNRARVQEVCQNLSIERLFYRTHDDEDVSPYVHAIETNWVEVDLPEEYGQISRILQRMVDSRVQRLRAHHTIDGNYVGKKQLIALGQRLRDSLAGKAGPDKGKVFASMVLQSSALSLLHATELLESQGIRSLLRFLNKVEDGKDEKRAYKNIVKDALYDIMKRLVVENIEVDHPKVEALRFEIIRQVGRPAGSKVLVFTQYRDTASLLVNSLRNDVFVVERFVGQMSKVGDEGLDQERQKEVLDRFRSGDITVLVATSVAEEGLDIPNVDLVVFYEPIPSEIRFIQRKGRTGRKSVGRLVILATRDSIDTAYHFASQRKIKRMREVMSSIQMNLAQIPRGPRPKVVAVKARTGPGVRDVVTAPKAPAIRPVPATRRPPTEQELVRDWLIDVLSRKDQVFIEEVFEEGVIEGLDRRALGAALDALMAEGFAFKPRWDVVRRVQNRTKDPGVIVAKVLKVYQGGATLGLEDGTNVILSPEEFPGNPSQIRKGRALKVKGEVYELDGRKHLRVSEVVE